MRGHEKWSTRTRHHLKKHRDGALDGQQVSRSAGSATGTSAGAWSLTARAGEDAIAGTGSHGQDEWAAPSSSVETPVPALTPRSDPHQPRSPSHNHDFAGALGSTHDLTAARELVLPALYPHTARGLPVLADKGYLGAGIGEAGGMN